MTASLITSPELPAYNRTQVKAFPERRSFCQGCWEINPFLQHNYSVYEFSLFVKEEECRKDEKGGGTPCLHFHEEHFISIRCMQCFFVF
jgi:hypothetical protein